MKEKRRLGIEPIIENRFCTGCGSCFAVCPTDCISMQENKAEGIYLPKINRSECNSCGICELVCPQLDIASRDKVNSNEFLGKNNFCFYGYSLNKDIRYEASSGGLITQLSLYALNRGLVDGVISVGPAEYNPIRFEAKICNSEEEVIKNAGSKYCPVSLNKVLKKLINENNDKRYLYIGLPCHIWGLKRIMKMRPRLKHKIKFVFGLFCSHTSSYKGTEFILKKWDFGNEEVKKLNYRGQGWPGSMTIYGNKNLKIPHKINWERYFGNNYFTPKYCFVCNDLYAVDSDISFGDAWLNEFREDYRGISMGIVRSDRGKSLMEKCQKDSGIFYNMIDKKKVLESQGFNNDYKNRCLSHRINSFLKNNKKFSLPLRLRIYNKLMIFNSKISQKKSFQFFLLILSGKIEKLYFKSLDKIRNILLK